MMMKRILFFLLLFPVLATGQYSKEGLDSVVDQNLTPLLNIEKHNAISKSIIASIFNKVDTVSYSYLAAEDTVMMVVLSNGKVIGLALSASGSSDLQGVLNNGATGNSLTNVTLTGPSLTLGETSKVSVTFDGDTMDFSGVSGSTGANPFIWTLNKSPLYRVDGLSTGGALSRNTFLGYNVGINRSDMSQNTAFGHEALGSSTVQSLSLFDDIAAFGYRAGYNTQALGGTFIGSEAGMSIDADSDYSLLIGDGTGKEMTDGEYNIGIGNGTLFRSTSLNGISPFSVKGRNVMIGLNVAPYGDYSATVAIGYQALNRNPVSGTPYVDAHNSLFAGYQAGYSFASTTPGDTNNSYFNNVIALGARCMELTDSAQNVIAVGSGRFSEVDRMVLTDAIGIGHALSLNEPDYDSILVIGNNVIAQDHKSISLPDWKLYLGSTDKRAEWDGNTTFVNSITGSGYNGDLVALTNLSIGTTNTGGRLTVQGVGADNGSDVVRFLNSSSSEIFAITNAGRLDTKGNINMAENTTIQINGLRVIEGQNTGTPATSIAIVGEDFNSIRMGGNTNMDNNNISNASSITATGDVTTTTGVFHVDDGGYTGITDGSTTPVPTQGAGTFVYYNNHFFGWVGSSWKQLDN